MERIAQAFCSEMDQVVQQGLKRGESRWVVLQLPSSPDHQHESLAERIKQLLRARGLRADLSRGPMLARYVPREVYRYDLYENAYEPCVELKREKDVGAKRFSLVLTTKAPDAAANLRSLWVQQRIEKTWNRLLQHLGCLHSKKTLVLDYAEKERACLIRHSALQRRYHLDGELYRQEEGEAYWIRAPESEQAMKTAIRTKIAQQAETTGPFLWRFLPGSRMELMAYPSRLGYRQRSELKAEGWRGLRSEVPSCWGGC